MVGLRVVKECQLDNCSVCGVYAELDDLERVLCYACAADIKHPLSTIEYLYLYGQYWPGSVRAERVQMLRSTLAEMDAELDYLEHKYQRSYGMRPDAVEHYAIIEDNYIKAQDELYELAPMAVDVCQ